ncbi:hypothetical protein [Proteocatella sphenisci]|uniref:hypothetical protein n=1 Tax=Proteocatella sphenisci TaxID=181070 RepID=UPI0004B4C6E8|nr:hypothetical protein [Proteocatella sphenisci]
MYVFVEVPDEELIWQDSVPALEKVQAEFKESQSGFKKVSLADMIVLGGCAGIQ